MQWFYPVCFLASQFTIEKLDGWENLLTKRSNQAHYPILPETLPARNSKIKLKSLKVQNSKTTAEPEFTTIKA
jgi:hypothetical protein